MTTNGGQGGFTKGPWAGRIWHDPVVVASDPSIDLNIALYTGGQPDRYQEWLANGRLVTSAPDLYAVVKYAVDNPEFNSQTFAAMCRAAIARAEGEA